MNVSHAPAMDLLTVVESIFLDALERTESERSGFLDQACNCDSALRERVEALLRLGSATAGHEVSTAVFRRAAGVALLATSAEVLPIRLERYDLVSRLGQGAFGVVYLAAQRSPVRRYVAVKVLRPGLDSAEVVRRFDAEKQALAALDHPNVARLYDAGHMPDGRPFFVMELIDGEPLNAFCDSRRLDIRTRLRLFLDACAGVEHAHRLAILHRDLKPANILVQEREGRAAVKVIDFGIARALGGGQLSSQTLMTEAGAVMGTPEYISPEQLEGAPGRVDTRSDVFALGVILYELLCGRLPFDSAELRASAMQMHRLICQTEPPRPGTVFGRRSAASSGAASAGNAAAARCTSPEHLGALLRRELEWIPLKAMRKDPADRYASVTELADDVRSYLNGLPLRAARQTRRYHLRKFVTRHRVPVASAALLMLIVVAALTVTTALLRRTQTAQATAVSKERAARYSAAMLGIQQGNAYSSLGRFAEARNQLETARGELEKLGGPAWVADLGMWDLARQANPPVVQWRISSVPVIGAVILPDGHHAVVASEDAVRLLDLHCGKVEQVQTIHSRIARLRVSGNGRIAFITTPGGALYRWTVDASAPVLMADRVGELLATDENGTRTLHWRSGSVVLFSTISRVPVAYTCPGVAMDGAFLPDGRFITCGRDGAMLRLWNPLHPQGSEKQIDTIFSCAMAVSPDGSRAAVSRNGDLLFVDMASWQIIGEVPRAHDHVIFAITWDTDGSTVYTCGWDGSCASWDPQTHKRIATYRGPSQPLNTLSASGQSRMLLGGDWSGAVQAWPIDPVPAMMGFKYFDKFQWAPVVALVCDDEIVAVGEASTRTVLYDRRTGLRLANIPNSRTSGVMRGATQTELIWGAFDGTAVVYDLANQKVVATLGQQIPQGDLAAGREVQVYCWRANGADRALIWRRPYELTAWDLSARKLIRTLDNKALSWQVAIAPDGRTAMAFHSSGDRGITMYGVDQPFERSRTSYGGNDEKAASAFSSDGSLLLTRRDHVEAFARLWRTSDMKELRQIPDGDSVVTSDLFWPDDHHLLSIPAMGDTLLRDLDTGEVLYAFRDLRQLILYSGSNYLFTLSERELCDLRWPIRQREMAPRASQSSARLGSAGAPRNPDDLLTVARWFALYGADEWAIDFFLEARQRGAYFDPLELAVCLARHGDHARAAAEYTMAISYAPSGAPASRKTYLRYCLQGQRDRIATGRPGDNATTRPADGPAETQ